MRAACAWDPCVRVCGIPSQHPGVAARDRTDANAPVGTDSSAMTNPPRDSDGRSQPRIDARQLWAGGVATAIVAGLVALVGVLVCRWLFGVPILAPSRDGAYGDVHTPDFVLAAAGAALAATALADVLMLSTPRPFVFFWWIVGLATLAVVLYPFSTAAPLSEKAATAVVDLVIGIAIGSLVSGAAGRSARVRRVSAGEPAKISGQDRYRDS